MTVSLRFALGGGSATVIALVVGTAAALGPSDGRIWILLCGAAAVIAALQAAALDPSDLTAAMMLSLPPVIALVAEGSPTWLIGPLAVLLLVAGELNVLGWECAGRGAAAVIKRRLVNVAALAGVGLAASVITAVIGGGIAPFAGGPALVTAAAIALGLMGRALFGRGY